MKHLWLAGLLCGTLFFSGCWSKREINELAIVSSAAFDCTDEGWEVTAEIFLPSSSQGAGGGGITAARQSWLAKGNGPTVFTAIHNLTLKVPRRVYWAHCSAIIIGEEVARSGLIQVLDFWDRDPEARRSALLFVYQGEAAQLLTKSFGAMERTVGMQLAGLANTSKISGYADVSTIHQFLVALSLPGMDPNTACLVLRPLVEVPGLVATGKKDLKTGTAVTELNLDKQALFRGTKLVGWLDKREARGLLWVRGTIKDLITIQVPGTRGLKIDLEVFNSSRKLSVKQKDGIPQITVQIELSLGLASQESSKELIKQSPSLERKAQIVVEKELKAAWSKACKLEVDPFGFGHLIYTKNPKLWHKLQPSWPGGVAIHWQVRAQVESSGLSLGGPRELEER